VEGPVGQGCRKTEKEEAFITAFSRKACR